jgi:hypothetical protein
METPPPAATSPASPKGEFSKGLRLLSCCAVCNGMGAPTLNGINVRKWKCHRPLDEDRSVRHEYYNRRW